jgi:uridine kinase
MVAPMLPIVAEAAGRITRDALFCRPGRALLVAISGIDASGKGTLAAEIERAVRSNGVRVALIGLDPWHHPRSVRFSEHDPAEHFYTHAYRFDDLFSRLIDPLRARRSVDATALLLDLATDRSAEHRFELSDVDVVLLEGIFLFKRSIRARYDLSIWVECGFESALERALRRNQEGESRESLVRDYERIYFPAQRIHFERDDPRSFADIVLDNP